MIGVVSLTDKHPIYTELYVSIVAYVSRQQLVVEAVKDQGVDPANLVYGTFGWRSHTEQRGQWGEWDFTFHGSGCRLKHRETGEPIDWDGPDPLRFDRFFYLVHLEWRLDEGHDLPELRTFVKQNGQTAVTKLMDDLIDFGVLSASSKLVFDPPSRAK